MFADAQFNSTNSYNHVNQSSLLGFSEGLLILGFENDKIVAIGPTLKSYSLIYVFFFSNLIVRIYSALQIHLF